MFITTKYSKLALLVGLCWFGTAVAQTDTPTDTPTSTPANTATSTPTSTPTVTPTFTKTPTVTRTAASTSTPLRTSTPEKTFTLTRTATATPTGGPQSSSHSNAGCIVLSATPQAVGNGAGRMSFNFWLAEGDNMVCGYDSAVLDPTPGVGKALYTSAMPGLGKCDCQDAVLYCVSSSGTVCWDECNITTPTVTSTVTNTPANTATPTQTPTDTPA